jgi:hypothetical protein
MIVAADGLISDHGSVTLYAAALGVPVEFGAFGARELDASTPLATLGRRAPHLPLRADLRRHAESLTAQARDPSRYGDLTDRVFAHRGRALERLRSVIYGTIGLTPPDRTPRVLPVALPEPEGGVPTAVRVLATLARAADHEPGPVVEIARFPATLEPEWGGESGDRHLAVAEKELDARLRESAAVLVRSAPRDPGKPEVPVGRWLHATLARYPGCRVAVATERGRVILRLRGGPELEATVDPEQGRGSLDVGALASAAYAAFAAGALEVDLAPGFVVVAGPHRAAVHVTRRLRAR